MPTFYQTFLGRRILLLVWGALLLNVFLGDAGAIAQESKTEITSATIEAPEFDLEKTLFSGDAPQSIAELKAMEQKIAELVEQVKPAIVNIQMGGAQGSGVVVSDDGYILTAAHVIGKPFGEAVVIFPDGTKAKATTLGVENRIDSGMLKIDEDQGDSWPYVPLGLSEELKQGQWVMSIAHPGGLDQDRGVVLRVGRLMSASGRVLRTDCTLVGGDSGGPLFDMRGEVIGINSRIGSQLWNNLHVPVDVFSENWDQLAEGIVIDGRPNLGFSVVEKTNKVESVVAGGAAEAAGVKVGDIILKIGGEETADREDIGEAIGELRPNMKTKIVIERAGKETTFELTVGQR